MFNFTKTLTFIIEHKSEIKYSSSQGPRILTCVNN